jgi:ribosomal RNA-processing protein 8
MFAVPGWSVPSSALKTQTIEKPNPKSKAQDTPASNEPASEVAAKTSKKRKRDGKPSEVNPTNLADLWETVIEKKSKPITSKEPKVEQAEKHQKVADPAISNESPAISNPQGDGILVSDGVQKPTERSEKRKIDKERKRAKKAKQQHSESTEEEVSIHTTKVVPNKPPPKPVQTLTPLQASMRQKLVSARFRHLNQTLYTTPSTNSLELFQQNPEMFQEYHEGFRRQVEVWPENPVDGYIQQIRLRGKARGPLRNKTKPGEGESDILPLPRTEGTCSIADLGCGDAALSHGLEGEKKKLKIQVFSYDLQSPSPLVTRADIANLPLKDGSVDVAIFCLALMGTNWVDFIEEAFRILRWKGELWVAEIKSRFGRVSGKNQRVEHSVGNRKKPDKKTLKKMEDQTHDADLLVEVDGHDDTKGETDVSAFVEVLSKRGFILQSEKAVDLSNRMFVKMSFVKGLTPVKGKCVPVPKGMAEMGMETWKKKPRAKFLDEEDIHVSSEATVLKPCVYKLR